MAFMFMTSLVDGRLTLPFIGSFDTDNVKEVFSSGGEVLKEFGGAVCGDAVSGLRSLGRSAISGLVAWKTFLAARAMQGLRGGMPLDGLATTTKMVAVELDAIETGRAGSAAAAAAAASGSAPEGAAEEEEDADEKGADGAK